jgi:hypothetical protein
MVSTKTRKRSKTSKRLLNTWNDDETVWGKNPELELFWNKLASGKTVVLIYSDKTYRYVHNLPSRTTKRYESIFNYYKEHTNIIAILSSNPSQDAYEQYLYPKAKDKSVNYVIEHYTKYFKPITPGTKLRIPLA